MATYRPYGFDFILERVIPDDGIESYPPEGVNRMKTTK